MRNGRQSTLERPGSNAQQSGTTVRCAIYTRKSTEEGLQQEFNSLDAQRESAEAFITSQRGQGWRALPDRYDDGGYTGGNMERPALRRLLQNIQAGEIDCVVVYKVDRLSRSLLDFARIMESFEKNGVSFVSVTQQFNTTASLGRLTLNILLSFAQFEREIIAERTRDKMSAARRKGKWIGGFPILGYDIDPQGGRLVVNPAEADQVREVFRLYEKERALIPVVRELNERGWCLKRWKSSQGIERGGRAFTKAALYKLLTNRTYLCKVEFRGTIYEGEHDAIVSPALWEEVQRTLKHNGRTGGAEVRNRYGAILKGLIRCIPCNAGMVHSYTAQKTRRYRYYVCSNAQQRGWGACKTKSVSAPAIENAVLAQVKGIAANPEVLAATIARLRQEVDTKCAERERERDQLKGQLQRLSKEMATTAQAFAGDAQPTFISDRLADIQDRISSAEKRLTQVNQEIEAYRSELIDESDVAQALREFNRVWESLTTKEQIRLVATLVEHVGYDGESGNVKVAFRSAGIKQICEQANGENGNVQR
jgi:site-specific DNA recombinase